MRKIIVAFGAIIILIVAYNYFSVTDVTTTGVAPESDEGLGSGIRKSFNKMIPGKSESQSSGKFESGDHVVVINSKPAHIDVDDAIDRIEAQKDLKDNEAIDFARWTLFSNNAKYSAEEKEIILERSMEILSPSEVRMITIDVLFVGRVPSLVDVAMNYQSQHMKRDEFENLIRDVLKKRAEPEIRSAVIEFAATKNIYVK